jgi:hypothetical protein
MKTLKDIAGSIDARYGTGTTKVWYMKPDFFRDGMMSVAWLEKDGKLPTLATLEQTHVCVGTLNIDHPEEAWQMMQGEFWSPKGEANSFILGLGLQHTSMSVGDIVEKEGVLFMVDGIGFKRLP